MLDELLELEELEADTVLDRPRTRKQQKRSTRTRTTRRTSWKSWINLSC